MKLLVAGDLYIHKGVSFSIDNLENDINQSDHFLVNLEAPISTKTIVNPVQKGGPNLSMNPNALAPLSKYFQKFILSGANNHIGDFGTEGVMETLQYFDENKLMYIGCGKDSSSAAQPLFLEDNIALLAIAENEFGIAEENKAGSNGLKIEENLLQIMKLSREGYYVVIYFHGGNEYSPIPNPFIKRLFRSFIDIGAKVVIGNHTHCPQGYETYNKGLIFYSLGNFVFDSGKMNLNTKTTIKSKLRKFLKGDIPSKKNFWDFGYMVSLNITATTITYDLIPYTYSDSKINVLSGQIKENFLQYLQTLSNLINDQNEYSSLWNTWTYKYGNYFKKIINTVSYIKRGKDPKSFLSFRNLITCESHREILLNMNYLIENNLIEKYSDHKKIEYYQDPSNFNLLDNAQECTSV